MCEFRLCCAIVTHTACWDLAATNYFNRLQRSRPGLLAIPTREVGTSLQGHQWLPFFNMIKRVFATDLMADRSPPILIRQIWIESSVFWFEIVFILMIFNIVGFLSNSYVNFGSSIKLVVPFVTYLIAHGSSNKMVPSDRSPTNWGLATDQWKLLFELVGDRSVTVPNLYAFQYHAHEKHVPSLYIYKRINISSYRGLAILCHTFI